MRQTQTFASVSTAASECYCTSCRWNDRAFSSPTTCKPEQFTGAQWLHCQCSKSQMNVNLNCEVNFSTQWAVISKQSSKKNINEE